MKKLLSILLVILANVAVVVHAIVPHHHHNRIFTRIVSVLDDNAKSLLTHSHVYGSEHHGLVVLEEYFAGTGTFLFTESGEICGDFRPDLRDDSPEMVADLAAIPYFPESPGVVIEHNAADLYYSLSVISSGLRAPPFCS